MDDIPNNENVNKEAFENLIIKLKDKDINQRLGFRENTAFIIALSDFCLRKNSNHWINHSEKKSSIDVQKYDI